MERKYGFRTFLNRVHAPGRRDYSVKARAGETEIVDGWRIIAAEGASEVTMRAAADLRDYLFTSMDVSALLERGRLSGRAGGSPGTILIGTREDFGGRGGFPESKMSCRISVGSAAVEVCGFDDRGTAQGCYFLEDLMNLRQAPLLEEGSFRRDPVFSPRMTHSGWGMDCFPDSHLSAIAHAGMDAVLVFVKDVDLAGAGPVDLRDLADRAGSFGIDVYLYSCLRSMKHPEEEGALEYYRSTYGRLFRECPGARGVVLVGESCEFPSKDTVNTTGKMRGDSREDGFSPKPSPGWWPCQDYPLWLEMIKKTVREQSPAAEIVFWTYNWGYAPEKDRIELIDSLPGDITLLVTFEMFEQIERENVFHTVSDYTISFEGPGGYFTSEAEAARRKNIRLYAMANTAGRTWDFGVVPYVPVPFQWARRHAALLDAADKYGLSGLMESHHYGFYPSVVSELAKWSFWTPRPEPGDILAKLAERDFGAGAATRVLECWEHWSRAIRDCYVATNEDQYGPFRVGPSYPFIFHPHITRTFESREISMPSSPRAYFGSRIVKTFYHPFENSGQSPGALRLPVEMRLLEKMLGLWRKGLGCMEEAVRMAPASKKENARRMLLLGRFIEKSVITALNAKRWYMLNTRLLAERNRTKALDLLDRIEKLALEEIGNAADTVPVVRSDSSLGWEPSMDYMADEEQLEWKIRQVRSVVEHDIPEYRRKLEL